MNISDMDNVDADIILRGPHNFGTNHLSRHQIDRHSDIAVFQRSSRIVADDDVDMVIEMKIKIETEIGI